MISNSLPITPIIADALDVTGIGPMRDTLTATNRAVSNAVDFSVSTGVLIVGWVAAGLIIIGLLRIIRSQNTRAASREKQEAARAKLDDDRLDRDIESRVRLAEAVQKLSTLIESMK